MRWLKTLVLAIIAIVVALLGILFSIRNQQEIPLDIIWAKLPEASLALWLLLSLVVGVILGMLAMTGMYVRLRTRLAGARKDVKVKQAEIDQLKKQGVQEQR
ncbi:lipopolysaccharide assembly protein LapA domain-containing protein [Carnimonas bestiolae]|uniref:lipopolysaccharide assembly protein LapA domain-containing protein n=1 Tax=Carnimonas bestiolae TaxID=3402172 RepID=UPI003EDBEDA2